ncbi:hypothetical protein Tmar_1231 [Thermaerobacter marianensis DSM 12885]|uniref:YcfA family protein n=1 Tax=Thermaerobacter marianensis (strain ATCC 700841 / DSM 12885 / JCM 10246 / 7p75a) TaxID=644966 RepID=E6SLB3_THEM7|nr:hypothetical protein Tmar_1231 [Thermaerobacter marianensis DSM 12885]
MKKEVHELLREAARQGWRIEDSGKHVKLYPPDPRFPPVVIAKTPSDWRAWHNNLARLRKFGLKWPPRR